MQFIRLGNNSSIEFFLQYQTLNFTLLLKYALSHLEFVYNAASTLMKRFHTAKLKHTKE